MQSILTAHDVKTGEVLYQGRLGEAKKEGFSASPVASRRQGVLHQ